MDQFSVFRLLFNVKRETKNNNENEIMNYKELDAWKESIELVQLVYEITQKFPSEKNLVQSVN